MLSKEEIKQSAEDVLTVPDIVDLTCYETLTVDKEDEVIDITEESPDQSWLCSLSKEELNDAFDNKFKQEEDKRYEKFIKEASYNDLSKRDPTYVGKAQVSRFRRRCFKYYESEIKNGFYTGFICSFRCQLCDNIVGSHVSPYKRVYWIHPKRCHYCAGKKTPLSHKDSFAVETDAKRWKKVCKGKGYMFQPAEHLFIHDF